MNLKTLEWLRHLLRLGASNVADAVIEDHIEWERREREVRGPSIRLRDARDQLHALRAAAGRKGGSHPKRKLWAVALADSLCHTSTNDDAWCAIPEAQEAGDEPNIERWIVYRDGDKLIAVDDATGREESIAKSTFLKHYLKRR